EAQAGKAARVTMAAILRGRLVELIVGRPGSADGAALLTQLVPTLTLTRSRGRELDSLPRGNGGGSGWGLRFLEPAPIDALAADAAASARRWDDILDLASRLDPPARLDPVASFAASLAGSLSRTPDEILVDDPAAIPQLRAAFPDGAVAHLPETEWPTDLDA